MFGWILKHQEKILSAGILFVSLMLLCIRVTWAPIPFDSKTWKSEDNIGQAKYLRLRMADWLIMEGRLIGLSATQVMSLLGDDGKPGYFREYDFVYYLGPERGRIFAIDSEWLCLKLDDSGLVNIVEIRHD